MTQGRLACCLLHQLVRVAPHTRRLLGAVQLGHVGKLVDGEVKGSWVKLNGASHETLIPPLHDAMRREHAEGRQQQLALLGIAREEAYVCPT